MDLTIDNKYFIFCQLLRLCLVLWKAYLQTQKPEKIVSMLDSNLWPIVSFLGKEHIYLKSYFTTVIASQYGPQ